ncbi:YczE/YyaS/YitT family protein [Dethiobacter alkaliphilus]|uniref:Integral membrane protein n=1 Tax=Dethiobacter alkaliphilus AHT 1 TaxID=555088 RepID=C0GH98_DETAL|nr:YitT family protein [Dethiobacter alkaliphilus]EEG77400.1 protein of unknown function DUF161 [Dethiobacter alkaliphilus AHT 1]
MSKKVKTLLRYTWILFGLFLMANGVVFLLRAHLGVSPWDVLHVGIAARTGLTVGRVIQLIGLMVVLLSWLLRVRPQVSTLLNMFFIGLFVDLVNSLSYIPQPATLWLKLISYVFGIAIFSLGTALYISGNRGAGPRDSLMLGLTRMTKLRVGTVRTALEVLVAIIGYFLGGPLGLGTVLFALLVGVFLEFSFKLIKQVKALPFWQSILS